MQGRVAIYKRPLRPLLVRAPWERAAPQSVVRDLCARSRSRDH
ncbi:unnamed protein product [Staurois parvus]|uniref:Uncharacterized protein n=1 Tax=Staurois parvus TaxID=386267 RepID=A0ABN9H516_9NEOB|nr:unnamed protein product [Staurois parvus]